MNVPEYHLSYKKVKYKTSQVPNPKRVQSLLEKYFKKVIFVFVFKMIKI